MELLNLDELVELKRFVTIRGKRFVMADRSVGQLIESIVVSKSDTEMTELEYFEQMVKTVQTILPDAPESVIRSLNMRQIVALLEFANKDPNALAAEAADEARAQGKSGKVESVKEVPVTGEA